jgi:hypothetical protein
VVKRWPDFPWRKLGTPRVAAWSIYLFFSSAKKEEREVVDLGEREQKVNDSDYLKVPAGEPIPLSVLALDLDQQPANGWAAYLAGQGISIAFDDLGRRCISRGDAKKLLDAQRQDEIRRQDLAARLEQEAVEKDRQRRAALPKGLAWHQIPLGLSPAEAMAASDPDRDKRPRRRSLLEESFAGDTLTMHPIREDPGES